MLINKLAQVADDEADLLILRLQRLTTNSQKQHVCVFLQQVGQLHAMRAKETISDGYQFIINTRNLCICIINILM